MKNPKLFPILEGGCRYEKKWIIILALGFLISYSSTVYANGVELDLIGREFSPGFKFGETTFGASFAGDVINEGVKVGIFRASTDHQGGPIEECGATNLLVRFKLIMNFFDGRRLVLVMPHGVTAEAHWDWDDMKCAYGGRGCEIHSIENIDLGPCGDDGDLWVDPNPNVSLIAEVDDIILIKRRFGSWGFNHITGGVVVFGWLIHTPPIFPAVIGTFIGN